MTMGRPVEMELKYLVRDAATAERLLTSSAFGEFSAGPPARPARYEDRYLDSADGALSRAGFAARLRQTPTETLVTVKSTATLPGALQRREELEAPADPSLDPRRWLESDARSLILGLCGDAPLVELVTIRQLRRRRELRADDTIAELSLDEVDVVAGDHVVDHFTELEVELHQGDEHRLLDLRTLLDGDAGLAPASGSKLERALLAARRAGGAYSPGHVTAPVRDEDPDGR